MNRQMAQYTKVDVPPKKKSVRVPIVGTRKKRPKRYSAGSVLSTAMRSPKTTIKQVRTK